MSGELWTEYPSAESSRPLEVSDELHDELVLHLRGQTIDANTERDDIVYVADVVFQIDRVREEALLLSDKGRQEVADYMQSVSEMLRNMTMNEKRKPAQEETKGE